MGEKIDLTQKEELKKMKEVPVESKDQVKPISHEELMHKLEEALTQNRYLREQMMRMASGEMIKRIEFLFKVLEMQENFSREFVNNCSLEIEDVLTLKEEKASE